MKWQRRLTIIHSFASHQYLMSFILIINNRLHLEKKVFLKRIHWIAVTLLLAVSYCSPYSIKDNRSKDNGTQNLPHQFVLRTNKSIKTCTPSFFTCLCFIWKWRNFVATKWIWYYHFAMNVLIIINGKIWHEMKYTWLNLFDYFFGVDGNKYQKWLYIDSWF